MDIAAELSKYIRSFFITLVAVGVSSFSHSIYAKTNGGFYLGIPFGTSYSNTGQNQTIIDYDTLHNEWLDNYYKNNNHSLSALIGLRGGYEFPIENKWLVELGIGAYADSFISGNGRNYVTFFGDTSHVSNYSYDIFSIQFMVESRIKWRIKRFLPFIMFGVGTALNRADNFKSQNVEGDESWGSDPFSRNQKISFAYQVGFGIDYQIYDNGCFGIAYRYAYLGNIDFGNGGANYPHIFKVGKIKTHSVMLNFTHRFK